jgi:hypothetical protein
MPRGTTDWDAKTYDRLAAPQEAWAKDVLARLPLDLREALKPGGPEPWHYVEETEARLERAGFVDVRCWLEERIVEPENPREYVAVVGLAAHHEQLLKPLVLRYVRLNIEARAVS